MRYQQKHDCRSVIFACMNIQRLKNKINATCRKILITDKD